MLDVRRRYNPYPAMATDRLSSRKKLRTASARYLKRLLLVASMSMLVVASLGNEVRAASVCPSTLSGLDCRALINNWVDWVPLGCGSPAGSSTTGLTGSDNEGKAFNFFMSKGLSEQATAATVGNLFEESHLDPTIAQTGGDTKDPSPFTQKLEGWGIAQWDPGAKIIGIAKDLGITTPIYELATQLNIVWAEMKGTAPTGYQDVADAAGFKNAASLADATEFFRRYFESGTNFDLRYKYAQEALKVYGPLVPQPGGISTGGGTDTPTTAGGVNTPSAAGDCSSFAGANSTGTTVFYSQHDPRWANKHFSCGGDCGTMSAEGCYLADLAMIASTLTGQYIYPDRLISPVGSLLGETSPAGLASLYHLTVDAIDGNPSFSPYTGNLVTQDMLDKRVIPALAAGQLVLAHGAGDETAPWVSGNHWVIIRGYDPATKMYSINDPWDFTKDPTPTQGPSNIDPAQHRVDNFGHVGPYTNDAFPGSAFLYHADQLYAFGKGTGKAQ